MMTQNCKTASHHQEYVSCVEIGWIYSPLERYLQNIDFWLIYAFSEKFKNYFHGFFDEHRVDCLQCQSVRLWQFTLTELIYTAPSCINRSLSIIDYDIY